MENIWENYNFDSNVQQSSVKEHKQLKSIKEIYNKCQDWINSKDKDKLKYIADSSSYGNLSDLQRTLLWYQDISELSQDDKNILFGDTILTINDIKEKMLKHLKENEISESDNDGDYDDEDDEDYRYNGSYDDCGHASPQGYRDVVSFFESLDEHGLMAIASGSVSDDYEIDINGGRSYLMGGSNIYLYAFNYLYYSKNLNSKEYDDMISNSGDADEVINSYYINDVYLPSDEEFDKIYHRKYTEKYQNTFDRYNSMISNIIQNFGNEPMLKEMIQQIKKLQADDAYIQAKVREIQIDKIIK